VVYFVTFATRTERDVLLLFVFRVVQEGEMGIDLEYSRSKKLQIIFGGVESISTFAVPNKTGIKKRGKRRDARAILN